MAQGGTTTIKPTAPLQIPNEQKWAREFDNNRQADAVADSLPIQNQNLNAETDPNINLEAAEDISKMNVGSIKEALSQATEIVGQEIFKKALRLSWLNLIDSCGLTFLYINFHFIMAYLVKNRYFCKFGEEDALNFGEKSASLNKVGGGVSETLMEIAEIIVLFVIDGLILFAILLLLAQIALIAWFATHPADAVALIGAAGQEIVNMLR
jgi:hypothetical protein